MSSTPSWPISSPGCRPRKRGFLQLFFVYLVDAAEDVGGERAVRVAAHEHPLHPDPREAVLVLFQVVDEVVADVAAHGDRRARRQQQLFVQGLAQPVRRGVDQLRELRQLAAAFGLLGGQLARVDLQREAGPVGDDDPPVAVEDLAPRRAHPVLAGAVVVRFGEVLLAVQHLQEPEAEEEDRKERQGKAAEDGDPQRQAIVHLGAELIRAPVHQALLVPSTVGWRRRVTCAASTSAGRSRRRRPK